MATYNIDLTASTLSFTNGTLAQFHQAIINGIVGTISSANIVAGQVGGSAPVTNIGPWLNGSTWYVWNGASYVPATLQVGDATNQVTISGTPTADRTITFQDKDGTLALTSDVYVPRPTVYPTLAPSIAIDWSASNSFGITLNQNVALTMSNSLPGQEVWIAIYNPAAATYTVSWSSVNWTGAAPTQPTDNKTAVYVLYNIGGHIYGKQFTPY